MENKVKKVISLLKEINRLETELDDPQYWINLAEKEAGWEPQEEDWISVKITFWTIRISIHHKRNEKSIYWINGQWFNTSLPENCPCLY